MHYYTHNIGEFAVETRFLSPEDIGVYVILKDEYFSTGMRLACDRIAELMPPECEASLKKVLARFFTLEDGFYVRAQWEKELAGFKDKGAINSENAKKRWAKRREANESQAEESDSVATVCDSHATRTISHATSCLTNNQKPRTNRTTTTTSTFAEDPALQAPPDLPAEDLWGDENPVPADAEAPAAEKPKLAYPRCEYEKVVALYHEKCPGLQRVMANSDARRRTVGARWKDFCREDGYKTTAEVLDAFSWYFDRVAASPFLMGQSAPGFGRDRAFVADFD